MQRPRRAKADAASLALARQLESEDARPRRKRQTPGQVAGKPAPSRRLTQKATEALRQTDDGARPRRPATPSSPSWPTRIRSTTCRSRCRGRGTTARADMGQHEIELRATWGLGLPHGADPARVVSLPSSSRRRRANMKPSPRRGPGLPRTGTGGLQPLLLLLFADGCCNRLARPVDLPRVARRALRARMHLMHAAVAVSLAGRARCEEARRARATPSPGFSTRGAHMLLWSIDFVKLRGTGAYVYPWLYDIDALGYGLFSHMAYYAACGAGRGRPLACRAGS